MSARFLVIPCGKVKLDRPAPAGELYVGSAFRMARAAADATGRPWLILSARHGLLDPSTVIAPYEQTLKTRGDVEQLARILAGQGRPAVVESWCPAAYGQALRGAGVEVHEPLAGLGLGYRRQYWRRLVEAAA